ncbi:MAG: serine protease [Candidatus Pacearchaeota archaeon]
MIIENEDGGRGTGFLVFRPILLGSEDEGNIFLVTNKHILGKTGLKRYIAKYVRIHYNIMVQEKIKKDYADLSLCDSNSSKIWREHPDKNVDVLAIEITHLFDAVPEIYNWTINYYNGIADKSIRSKLRITIGDDVFVIGYPLGLTGSLSNFPIARAGIIASRIGHEVIWGAKKLRAFFVDSAIFPGSSGSPVILKPTSSDMIYNNSEELPSSILLGIISQVKLGPIKWKEDILPNYAHLGLAYDAETIKETIDLFYQ